MKREPTAETRRRLETERNVWLATTRKSGRPHLVPVWFVWHAARFWIGMNEKSVKARNLQRSPLVSLALENGDDVVICEGEAERVERPYSADILQKFQSKYGWNIATDDDYGFLAQVTPNKWMIWGEEGNYA